MEEFMEHNIFNLFPVYEGLFSKEARSRNVINERSRAYYKKMSDNDKKDFWEGYDKVVLNTK